MNTVRIIFLGAMMLAVPSLAHESSVSVSQQVSAWLEQINVEREIVQFDFESSKRFDFTWLPGARVGIRLDAMDEVQRTALRRIFRGVLSEAGANKVDAIIATEAALAVLSNSPEHRNPGKYYTAIFGEPGSHRWGLRFEGHHLSVNLTFQVDKLISATPLFLGANPETVPSGPDKGLRALENEVDLAKQLFLSLEAGQRQVAKASDEWFGGFLSSPGQRRAKLGKPAGISATELNAEQSKMLKALISSYVFTIAHEFSEPYFQQTVEKNWSKLRFYWKGSVESGGDYYYRIAGGSLLIEQETQGSDNHIHAIWRDARQDFGE